MSHQLRLKTKNYFLKSFVAPLIKEGKPLYNGGFVNLSKEEIADSISKLGKPTNIRGEALTLSEFAELSIIIYDKLNS